MTAPRKSLVDPTVTPYYHCISRCVRRAMLCGEGSEHRKQWIEQRLQQLASLFAIDVCGYAIMDNHLHVLLRLDGTRAQTWTDLDVAQKWGELCPPRDVKGRRIKVTSEYFTALAANAALMSECRRRLTNLGWFMKFLKEPIARRANREDDCTGAFWEGRFKSIAILDQTSLLATCAYIDLNPVAAGVAATPEKSRHTSLKARLDHVAARERLDKLREASPYSTKFDFERGHWLLPIEDKRDPQGKGRAGMVHGLSLTGYLQLIDWSSRVARPGKVSVSETAPPIFERLQIDAAHWQATLAKLLHSRKSVGNYFGATPALDDLAHQKGRRFLKNLTGRQVRSPAPHAT